MRLGRLGRRPFGQAALEWAARSRLTAPACSGAARWPPGGGSGWKAKERESKSQSRSGAREQAGGRDFKYDLKVAFRPPAWSVLKLAAVIDDWA